MKAGFLACWLLLLSCGCYADDYADLFREAAVLTQLGKYQEAISKYQAALALRPGAPEALNNLAVVYYQERRYADAYEASGKIWRGHPELKSAALIAGMSAVQCNKPQAAIEPLQQLLRSEPANRDALLALASAYLALHDLKQAAALYDLRVKQAPDDSTAWYGRAICYEQLAEHASRKLAQMPGGTAYSKRLLGEYLQSAGDKKLAAEAFGQAESSGPVTPEALKQYETARELAGKSRESFEQLIQVAPDSWQALVFRGDVDRQHGDLTAALAKYKRAAELQPSTPAPLLGKGTVYWELGDFENAASNLRRVLELNPKAQQALFELANIAVRRRADREAIPLLREYLASQPDALAARADLGKAYAHIGQNEDAVRELKLALPSDERGDIHYELSLALKKLGRAEEAQQALERSKVLRQAQLAREQRLHSNH